MRANIVELRKTTGLTIQLCSALPTILLAAMGFGGGTFSLTEFAASVKSPQDYMFFGGLVVVPLLGAILGFFVKRGHRFAYGLSAIFAIGFCFPIFPVGAVLGVTLLIMLGRVCWHELRQ